MTRGTLPPSSPATPNRHPERAKHGSIFVRFEMTPNAVDRLIALGWLNSESRRDPYAVTVALIKFGTQALWPDQ
jgi:hypothetical protein